MSDPDGSRRPHEPIVQDPFAREPVVLQPSTPWEVAYQEFRSSRTGTLRAAAAPHAAIPAEPAGRVHRRDAGA